MPSSASPLLLEILLADGGMDNTNLISEQAERFQVLINYDTAQQKATFCEKLDVYVMGVTMRNDIPALDTSSVTIVFGNTNIRCGNCSERSNRS